MSDNVIENINKQVVASAFSKQSAVFDELYDSNSIIQYKRERVRNHVQKYLHPDSYILELNAGTGEDAIYFARQGYRVHATDIAMGMQDVLSQKVANLGLKNKITNELCSFTLYSDNTNGSQHLSYP